MLETDNKKEKCLLKINYGYFFIAYNETLRSKFKIYFSKQINRIDMYITLQYLLLNKHLIVSFS